MVTHSVNLTSGITESFFANIHQLAPENLTVRKRLTEITLELLQNIRKHSTALYPETLSIKKYAHHFLIEAGNPIHSKEINALKKKIRCINTLDQVKLRTAHTHMLREGRLSEKSGAGLGLYRIAMRAKSALAASFTPIDQEHSIVTFHITLAA